MREGIHPAYYQAKVVCNCGNEFVISSTRNTAYRTINFSYLQRLRLYASAFFVMERIYEDFRYWWPGCY